MPDNIQIGILHPETGEVHVHDVPPDTSVSDFHDAMLASGEYEHPALNAALPVAQPTEEGTLEESPEFQAANRKIFDSMNHGKTKGENAAYLFQNKPAVVTGEQFNETAGGGRSMHLNIPNDAVALTHVHPDLGQPQLSPADIKVMQDHKIPVYAVSKAGLFTVDGDGKRFQVFKGTDWLSKDFRGNKKFNEGIVPGHYTIRYEQDGKEHTMDAGDAKNPYPLEAMNKLKKDGAKRIQTFEPGELAPKK
ncbi:MAG: hypothetical protein WBF09_05080 [Candidatus Acidiferrum sp.]